MLTRQDWADSAMPIARGTGIGILLGLIPGIGTILPTIISYAVEKRVSRHPERFGQGAIEGVAGPETTNNAYANASMIPLFTLGIPASPTIAVLLGAFMMNGLTPGPFLFRERPDFVWAVDREPLRRQRDPADPQPAAGRPVGAATPVPYSILFPLVLAFTAVGAYVTRNSLFDVGVLIVFGFLGYACKKIDFPVAPMAFTLILGPLTEKALRQALSMSGGDVAILTRGPLATGLLAAAAAHAPRPPWRLLWGRVRPPRPEARPRLLATSDALPEVRGDRQRHRERLGGLPALQEIDGPSSRSAEPGSAPRPPTEC